MLFLLLSLFQFNRHGQKLFPSSFLSLSITSFIFISHPPFRQSQISLPTVQYSHLSFISPLTLSPHWVQTYKTTFNHPSTNPSTIEGSSGRKIRPEPYPSPSRSSPTQARARLKWVFSCPTRPDNLTYRKAYFFKAYGLQGMRQPLAMPDRSVYKTATRPIFMHHAHTISQ